MMDECNDLSSFDGNEDKEDDVKSASSGGQVG
jgi:hypothetical protein